MEVEIREGLERSISQVTRRNIADEIRLSGINWAGRFEEQQFLARIYDLASMQSTDDRFDDAAGDIYQHRERNHDWNDDWVFYDARFRLLSDTDERFLNFLCETLHPVVRSDEEQLHKLLEIYNRHLAADCWEIVEQATISGRPVFAARRRVLDVAPLIAQARKVAQAVDAEYIMRQIARMETAIEKSPDLAIGTAKEFLETIAKTVLSERNVQYDNNADLPSLLRICLNSLPLIPDGVNDPAAARDAVKSLLGNLVGVANRIGNIRSTFGTGHGREADRKGLEPFHARLVVSAAIAVGVFAFQAHQRFRKP